MGYITYDDLHLYIAVKAFDDPQNVRASIRPRDDFKMLGDDTIFIALDPFADARNNLLLGVNPVGSQLDARAVNATTDDDRYDISFNVNYESAGQLNDEGYVVEFKIPFSEIPSQEEKIKNGISESDDGILKMVMRLNCVRRHWIGIIHV